MTFDLISVAPGFLALLFLGLASGCNKPRSMEWSQASGSTAARGVVMRPDPLATSRGALDSRATSQRLVLPNAQTCTLSLLAGDGIIDCVFTQCPPDLTAPLLVTTNLFLNPISDAGYQLSWTRDSPPFSPASPWTLRKDQDGWRLVPPGPGLEGECSVHNLLSHGSVRVTGVSVRRTLPGVGP